MSNADEEHARFDEEEDLDDTEGDDTDMDEDDDGGGQPPPPIPIAQRQIPNPSLMQGLVAAPHNGAIPVIPISSAAGDQLSPSDVKRPRIEERRPPPSASLDESRRLFQRLWTDEDEIKILKGFLEFTSSRGTTFASHQYDTGPFYESIKNELQLDFNKNQLIEKLRRLKKKYRNTANRMANHGKDFSYKSPHEKATYEIARKIWSASIKTSRDSDEDDLNPYGNNNNNTSDAGTSSDRKTSRSRRRGRKRALDALPVVSAMPELMPPPAVMVTGQSEGVYKVEVQTVPTTTPVMPTEPPVQRPLNSVVAPPGVPSVIEETMKSCISPLFKELLSPGVSASPAIGINLLNWPPLFSFGGNLGNLSSDERWKKQQILELEVYLKRLELIRDHIKLTLAELKAPSSAGS